MAWVAKAESGLRLTVGWSWMPPPMPTFQAKLDGGLDVEIEIPQLRVASGKLDLQPGRRLLSLSRLPGGRTAAVWVDYQSPGSKR